jgi:Xaa-Pro dipeptidase
MSAITRAKIAQAQSLCAEHGWGAWVFLGRETPMQADPLLELILEGGLTWLSALIITPTKAVAVVGNYDADPLIAGGDWDVVDGYVEDFAPNFLKALAQFAPDGALALNWSLEDSSADGLTYGLWQKMQSVAPDREWVSAQAAAARLRGQKSAEELRRIRLAIAAGDEIFAAIPGWMAEAPSEREIHRRVHQWAAEHGLGFSWDPAGDPIVNHGPDSMIGHGVPSDSLHAAPGQILHVDLGVIKEGYSSDIQRCWMAVEPGGQVPEDVLKALDAVYGAISAGAALVRPGVLGKDVDAAARASLVASGWPEYKHAFGHQVGLRAHDGGAVLGPAWPRYGTTVETPLREGEVYTLELGVTVPGRGYLGLEEMVVVTADGIEWLSERQSTMPTVEIRR